MTGLIGFGNNKGIGTADIATSLDIFAGQIGIRLIPTNAVGNNISKCAKLRDGNSGSMYDIATATPPQEFALPLAEGVTPVTSFKNTYSKDQFGIVRVWFSVHFESIPEVNAPVFTLPEGFRPDSVCCSAAILSMSEFYCATINVHPSGGAIIGHGTIGQSGAINLHGFIEFPAAS